MKKIFVLALLMVLVASTFTKVWHPTMKLLTPEIGYEYGLGESGHSDLRLGLRYNFPPMENLVLGFCYQTGAVIKDDYSFFYIDELDVVYNKLDKWRNTSYDTPGALKALGVFFAGQS